MQIGFMVLAAIAFTQIRVAAVGIEASRLDIPAMILDARVGVAMIVLRIAIAADAQLVMRSIGCGDGKAAAGARGLCCWRLEYLGLNRSAAGLTRYSSRKAWIVLWIWLI